MAAQKVVKVTKTKVPKAVPSGADAKSGFVPRNPENQSTKRKGKRRK